MIPMSQRLYMSTVCAGDTEMAEKYGLGLEIAEYCTAFNMDTYFAETDKTVRKKMESAGHFTFHFPFNELCPAAIDPLVVEITERRYLQALDVAEKYGITRLVVHSGYVPLVYYKEWFTEKSIEFWKRFLGKLDKDVIFCYENVMEDSPDMLYDIVSEVNDERFGLCLDVGHAATIVSNTHPREWLKKYGGRLYHMHIHNNDGKMDYHNPLGDGVLDMKELIDMGQAYDKVTFTIESLDGEKSCAWLKENGYI